MNKKLQQAIEFIVDNDGVLVDIQEEGCWCEYCEASSFYLHKIVHDKDCVFNTLKNAAENMQLSLNFS